MLSAGRSLRPWLLGVAALLGVVLTARLGFWQLDRGRQKLDLQQQISARADLPPLAQADLARQADAASAQHYRRIGLRGRWLADHTVYLDNRQMNARPGFFVLTPLLLLDAEGRPGGDAVLVQRGWVARDFVDRSRLAPLATPGGEVTVTGRIAPPPSKLLALGGTDTGPIRQNLDVGEWAQEIGQRLLPLSLQQTLPETAALADGAVGADGAVVAVVAVSGDGLLRQWPVPAVDVAKHHGYAFQWFAMSALIAGLFVWFQLLRPRFGRSDAAVHGQST